MLSTSFRNFLGDESGGYTIWSLLWFSLYVAMGGLAVDMTDAYRNQTLLQSTADASALAAVMSLPDQTDAVAQAVSYSTDNMTPAINGTVLRGSEVFFGNWDFDTRTFTPGTTSPDAVWVITRRSDANENPVATNFLRILGLWGLPVDRWNISVQAIAVGYVSKCRRGGFVAANKVDVTSGNIFYNDICIHGQNMYEDPGKDWAVDMNNSNVYESGVEVSAPNYDYLNNTHNNYGLDAAMNEGDSYPVDALYGGVQKFINGMTDLSSGYTPNYINAEVGTVTVTPIAIDENYPGTGDQSYVAGNIYYATCNSSKALTLPTDTTIKNVVIISECPIKASTGLVLEGVVIASTAVGNGKYPLAKNAIDLASAARIGAADFCESGKGGVELYALASVHVAAKLGISGLRAVVGGDFQVAAQADIIGISVQAGNDIIFTAAGNVTPNFGLCPQGTLPPGVFALQYRLVL